MGNGVVRAGALRQRVVDQVIDLNGAAGLRIGGLNQRQTRIEGHDLLKRRVGRGGIRGSQLAEREVRQRRELGRLIVAVQQNRVPGHRARDRETGCRRIKREHLIGHASAPAAAGQGRIAGGRLPLILLHGVIEEVVRNVGQILLILSLRQRLRQHADVGHERQFLLRETTAATRASPGATHTAALPVAAVIGSNCDSGIASGPRTVLYC